jgi:hypothetical protein
MRSLACSRDGISGSRLRKGRRREENNNGPNRNNNKGRGSAPVPLIGGAVVISMDFT